MDEALALATIADAEVDEATADQAIIALHNAATGSVLKRAVALTAASDVSVRSRAASVLGQLGVPERAFPDECLDALIALLEVERHESVIESALIALGHLKHARHVEAITRFSTHVHSKIRWAVAFALGGRSEPEAIAALISLTRDTEAIVRDWAAFGIGALGTVNTPEVREALFNRLGDSDSDTHFEAMCGLAHHGDRRVVPYLIDRLRNGPADSAILCATDELLGWDDFRAENERLDEVLENLAKLL